MGATDLAGLKFGRLEVVSRSSNNAHKKARWQCRCECGEVVVVLACLLRNGQTKSCGCLHSDVMAGVGRSNLSRRRGKRYMITTESFPEVEDEADCYPAVAR